MSKYTTGTTELEFGGWPLVVSWKYTFGREATRIDPPEDPEVDITNIGLMFTFMDGTQPSTQYLDITNLLADLGADEQIREALEESGDFPPEEHDPREDDDGPDFEDTEGAGFALDGEGGSL